jgi:hypothetical protein
VYVAVLGTSLIVSLLALSALALQRIQNRMLATSSDIRQAQLNAESAVELGLLAMKQDTNWRSTYTSGHWFTNRALSAGTCSLDGIDPADGNLSNNSTDPVTFTGIGDSGSAEQRVQVTVDPRAQPLSCLRSAAAAGHAITVTNSILVTAGTISANTVSATASTIYGNVQAATISGSTYAVTPTPVNTSQLPTMPTWSSLFDYYKTNGSQLDVTKMPTTANNFARNTGVEAALGSVDASGRPVDWTGAPLNSASTATITQSNATANSGTYSLFVSPNNSTGGAAQYIDAWTLPGQQYFIDCKVKLSSGIAQNFVISLTTRGTGAEQTVTSAAVSGVVGVWKDVSATLTAPSWTGNLAYAYVKIADSSGTNKFYVDDLVIREAATGYIIYQKVMGTGVNTLYSGAPVNAQGIYWIDCANTNLIVSRSRIKGTLLVINPGPASCVGPGPVRWSPAVPGYPALLVHADTASKANILIEPTNRVLSETENGVNYNPAGAPSDDLGQNTTMTDIYSSEISGLVAVENNLSYLNNGLIRGSVVVGNDITSTGGSLELSFRPESLLNPPPGFTGTTTYVRRASSAQKAVSP